MLHETFMGTMFQSVASEGVVHFNYDFEQDNAKDRTSSRTPTSLFKEKACFIHAPTEEEW